MLGESSGRSDREIRLARGPGSVTTFFAYNLLTVGTFPAYFGLYWLWRQNWIRSAWETLVRATCIALAVFAGLNVALWLGTGYHPYVTFRHAMATQALINWRPYYPFPLTDPYDFLLGAGIIALPILLVHLQRLRDTKPTNTALTIIGLATIVTIDLSGLLRGEAARIWIFLLPLLAVPAALELARFSRPWRLSIFVLQWWIVVCLKAKMSFVNP